MCVYSDLGIKTTLRTILGIRVTYTHSRVILVLGTLLAYKQPTQESLDKPCLTISSSMERRWLAFQVLHETTDE